MLFTLIFGRSYSVKRAYLFLFIFLLPSVLLLTNEAIWDDLPILAFHTHWSWDALLGRFFPGNAPYWRPLTVLTMVIPSLLSIPVWVNKLISVVLFFIQGCVAIAIIDRHLQFKNATANAVPIICFAVLIALHPVFAESTLWISSRGDLLLGIFVLSGIYRILNAHATQLQGQQPQSIWKEFCWNAALTFLACTSKETGMAWGGMALITIFVLSRTSSAEWKRYWIASAASIATALVAFLIARTVIMGQPTGMLSLPDRQGISAVERLQSFSEFFLRSLLNIFAPIFDQSPFKSPGWFYDYPSAVLASIVLTALCITGWLLFKLYKKNKVCACLCLSAFIIVIFHAVLTTFSEPTTGSILSDRYLTVGSILIFMSMAILSAPETQSAATNTEEKIRKPIAIIFILLLLQSLALWSESRQCWQSNLALWRTAWNHGSQSRTVAENYAGWSYERADFTAARNVAQTWIEHNQIQEPTPDMCTIYMELLDADIRLNDQKNGATYALRAVPIGTCHYKLTRFIITLLIKDNCDQVLPLIYKTIANGEHLNAADAQRFRKSEQRKQLLLDASYAETRCGDKSKALSLLHEVAGLDKDWAVDGEKARELIKSAEDKP